MARPKLVPSKYTVFQQWASDRCGLFHSLRGSILSTSPEVFRAVSEGHYGSLKPECIESLREHGFLVAADRDETEDYLRAIQMNQQSQPPTVEITFLATGADKDQGIQRQAVRAVQEYLDQIAGPKVPLLVKFRYCGHSIHPIQERREAFETLFQKDRAGLNVFKMWLTDAIREIHEPLSELPIAYFFQWHLQDEQKTESCSEMFRKIRELAQKQRIVFIQITADDPKDIQKAAKDIKNAAKICKDLLGTYICWGLGKSRDTAKTPYFIPPVCEPDRNADHVQKMCAMVGQLRSLGLPVPLPVLLRHQQGGCSYTHPLSVIFDRNGKKHRCLLDGVAGVVKSRRKGKESSCADGAAQCSDCAMMPVCEAVCPRQMRAGQNCEEHREIVKILTDPLVGPLSKP